MLRGRGALTEVLPAFAAMLVAVPAAIANGLVMYAPLGAAGTAAGALAGLVGAVALGLVAPLAGGTPRLVSAPSPAAAAVALCLARCVQVVPERVNTYPAPASPFLTGAPTTAVDP